MIPKIFKQGDLFDNSRPREHIAQEIFETWVKDNGKVVCGVYEEDQSIRIATWYEWADKKTIETDEEATHHALLICIEKINKKECEHKKIGYVLGLAKCSDCGKNLRIKYEVIK